MPEKDRTTRQPAGFRVVVLEHGYSTTEYERAIATAAGGAFVHVRNRPLDGVFQGDILGARPGQEFRRCLRNLCIG